MKRSVVTIIAVLVVSTAWLQAPAYSQQGESDKGTSVKAVERKNRAPVSKEILRVKLPRATESKLPNGLMVLVLEEHKLPTVAMSLWIKTGALADPKELPGLAKFTAEMLREGTARRTSAQQAAEVDDIGATLGASADFGSSLSTVSASGLVENLDKLLDLTSDMVLNPAFAAEELEKYRTRQLNELEQERAEPEFLSLEKFNHVLYRGFPAAVVSPTPESVKGVTVEDLRRFHAQYYVPNNAILGVAGDITTDQLLPLLRKYLGDWKSRPLNPLALASLPPPAAAKIYLVDRPKSVQTNIVAGV